MSVPNYKTIKKQSIDNFIKEALEDNSVMVVAPLEHYTQVELKEIADKAKDRDLIVTIKAEYSYFYQGVLIGIMHKDNGGQYKDIM